MNPDPGSEHSSIRMKLPPHSWISCSSAHLQNMNSVIVDPDHIVMDLDPASVHSGIALLWIRIILTWIRVRIQRLYFKGSYKTALT